MRGKPMARKLTNNNAHFQRAVKRLPLGVASNFRYWGEERTIYVKQGKGARIVDLDDNVYVDYRMGYGPNPRLCGRARGCGRARRHERGRRVRARHRARAQGCGKDLEDGARRGARAVLELR